MGFSITKSYSYILISILLFSGVTRADFEYGGVEARPQREAPYAMNQNIENTNYMDNPQSFPDEIPVLREVRNSQDEQIQADYGPSEADFVNNAPRVEREPMAMPEPAPAPMAEPEPAPLPEPLPLPVPIRLELDNQNIDDVIEQGDPQMIPEATNRQPRGNGADSIELNIIGSLDLTTGASADTYQGPATEATCNGDGMSCTENEGCCSRFCSWTKGFTCHTISG